MFIDCLLASADYDSFYSVMIKEAKKNIIMRNAGNFAASMEPPPGSASAAESKEADEDYGGDAKGGDEK